MGRRIHYYTLENLDGHIYMGCATKKLAKQLAGEMSNEGICYRRTVGNKKIKFQFMW